MRGEAAIANARLAYELFEQRHDTDRWTIHAVADHGTVTGDVISGTYGEARAVFTELEKLGVSYDDVVRVLEVEGVDKFTDSGDEVLATLTKQLEGAPLA